MFKSIGEVLTNVDHLIRAENPLTLKYFFLVVHDLNLVHFLAVLGYYVDVETTKESSESWTSVKGVDFNDSVRFEVYETVLFTHDSLNDEP